MQVSMNMNVGNVVAVAATAGAAGMGGAVVAMANYTPESKEDILKI